MILEFTPLEFETDVKEVFDITGGTIRIYSVGVWNKTLRTWKVIPVGIRIYSVGVWNVPNRIPWDLQ